MNRRLRPLADLFGLLIGLVLCAVVIVLALVVRLAYEIVMLPVRVYRVERDGWPAERAPGVEPDVPWPRKGRSMAEHLVAEDREGTGLHFPRAVHELQPLPPAVVDAFVRNQASVPHHPV